MIIKRLINQSIQNQALNSDDVKKCMNACLKGGATPAQISSFFTSLLMRGFSQEDFTFSAFLNFYPKRIPLK